eukprot:gene6566-3218_t
MSLNMQENHVVILNWNDDVPSMLRQMSMGKKCNRDEFYSKAVAVMSTKPKSEMDQAIATAIKHAGGAPLNIFTRQGNPGEIKDLQMVGAQKASAVLVMQPKVEDCNTERPKVEDCNTERALFTASAMALSSTTEAGSTENVVLQSPIN